MARSTDSTLTSELSSRQAEYEAHEVLKGVSEASFV